jgi:hypothetical protein
MFSNKIHTTLERSPHRPPLPSPGNLNLSPTYSVATTPTRQSAAQ